MPEIVATDTAPDPAQQKLDHQLLLSLLLPPLAALINVIVGYTVAHWITIIAYKRTGYLVSACCFLLCAVGASLAWKAQPKLTHPDETTPQDGRRLFMVKLALLLSGLSALVVLGGTLVLITLQPND